jgi:hypothetical protein
VTMAESDRPIIHGRTNKTSGAVGTIARVPFCSCQFILRSVENAIKFFVCVSDSRKASERERPWQLLNDVDCEAEAYWLLQIHQLVLQSTVKHNTGFFKTKIEVNFMITPRTPGGESCQRSRHGCNSLPVTGRGGLQMKCR